jgi:hypothetical protein
MIVDLEEIKDLVRANELFSSSKFSEITKAIELIEFISKEINKQNMPIDKPLDKCFTCECKSADCAYGDLRGSQSCYDTLQRFKLNTST